MNQTTEIVICGAGIIGASAAHFLSKAGIRNILLVDERPPLSFTSDRSTECYRNWWPDPQMLALMNRSIDLMEGLADESGNIFRMNRRGYLYVTADEDKIAELENASHATSELGAGPLRIHSSDSSSRSTGSGQAYQPSSSRGFSPFPREQIC
jgi:sarcosine oxidase, subunit beta